MYRVRVQNFEGPLDLLLFFIKRDELNIYDIPIAGIIREFLEYVHLIQQLDLDYAGDFLLMAANLMQIKVRMLLPRNEDEDEEEDPRAELIRRLLEYKRFKEVSESLKKMEDKQRKVFYRENFKHDKVEAKVDDTNLLKEITLFDLLKAFRKAIDNIPKESLYTVRKLGITIEDQIEFINSFFTERKQVNFLDLVSSITEKIIIVVTFVALLELMKTGQVKVYQDNYINDFLIYRLED
jgi:segregation and condensation protein A